MKKPAEPAPESDLVEGFPHPRETSELIGHTDAEASFLSAWNSGKMPHAWLITGERGIGKATLAWRMARFILQHPAHTADSLHTNPDDPVIRRILSLGHTDLSLVRRQWDESRKQFRTVISVDDIRHATKRFSLSAGEGGWRVCIIDAADDMNHAATAALLKTLEEPPQRALFLMPCHRPGLLPATILSRCRRLPLRPLTDSQVSDIITPLLPDASEDDRRLAISLAEGSAGRALALGGGGDLTIHHDINAILNTLPTLDVAAVHKLADRVAARGAAHKFLLLSELLADQLARIVRRAANADNRANNRANNREGEEGDSDESLGRLAAAASPDRWAGVRQSITDATARTIALNMNRKQAVLAAFSTIEAAVGGRAP